MSLIGTVTSSCTQGRDFVRHPVDLNPQNSGRGEPKRRAPLSRSRYRADQRFDTRLGKLPKAERPLTIPLPKVELGVVFRTAGDWDRWTRESPHRLNRRFLRLIPQRPALGTLPS